MAVAASLVPLFLFAQHGLPSKARNVPVSAWHRAPVANYYDPFEVFQARLQRPAPTPSKINKVKKIMRFNPELSAEKDPLGLRPGTHLVSFTEDNISIPYPFNPTAMTWKNVKKNYASPSLAKRMCNIVHHLVYLGNGTTIGFPEGLGQIENNHTYFVVPHKPGTVLPPHVVVERSLQLLAEEANAFTSQRYNLFGKNCEHFATFLLTGTARSIQADAVLIPLTILAQHKFVGGVTEKVTKWQKMLYDMGILKREGARSKSTRPAKQNMRTLRKYGLRPGMTNDQIDAWELRQRRKWNVLGLLPKKQNMEDAYQLALHYKRQNKK